MGVKVTPKLKEAIDEMREDYNRRVTTLQELAKSPDFAKKCDSREFLERYWDEYWELSNLEKFLLIFTKPE